MADYEYERTRIGNLHVRGGAPPIDPGVRRDRLVGGVSPTIGGPERALWAAILADAVAICVGNTSVSLEDTGAAHRWIDEGRNEFGGFAWCCDLLGLDDQAIRERVAVRTNRLTSLGRRRWVAGWSLAGQKPRATRKVTEPARHLLPGRF